MRNLILPVVFATLLVPAAPAMASSATATASKANQSALGRGFGRRSPSFGSRSRYRSPRRTYRRPGLGVGRFFRGVLQVLGLAFLFNMLFGWGAGGSPLGLILLVGLIVWLATRRRRRRFAYTY